MASNHKHIMDKGIEAGLQVKPYIHFDAKAEWKDFVHKMEGQEPGNNSNPDDPPLRKWLMAATILCVLAAFYLMTKPVKFTESLMTGDKASTITLFEGSRIDVEKNSVIHFPVRKEDIVVRRVVLEKGLASFDIKPHELPFVISVDNVDVEVTGTSFTIDKTSGKALIDVKEGNVRVVKNKDQKQQLILKAGDKMKVEQGEMYLSSGGGPFERKTCFTHTSKLQDEEKKAKESKRPSEFSEIPEIAFDGSSKYRMVDVIKYLDKVYKKQLKFRKKRKLKTKEIVILNLQQDLKSLLETMKQDDLIGYEDGKCEGCYVVFPVGEED